MSCKPNRWLLVVPVLVLLLSVRTAPAEFTLSIADTDVIAGSGALTLEVGITPDAGSAGLSDYILILEITEITGAGDSTLRFIENQTEAFLEDADYIFAGNSDVTNEGDSAVFSVTAEELALEDLTADFTDSVFSTRRLMATFDIEHVLGTTAASATVGNQYEVSISNESDFGNASGAPIEFSSSAGILTIVAIPEPGVASFLLLTAGATTLRRRRR
ncbi:MAG: hypothetical protein AAGJ83_07860 [Planctomycetota bacterium]